MSKLSPDALKATIDSYIGAAKTHMDHNTVLGVQTILWIIDKKKEELFQMLNEKKEEQKKPVDYTHQTKYLVLEKNTPKNRGKIVFPSGHVDSHEVNKNGLDANGVIMAAMREVDEEFLGLVKVTPSSYIDTYIYKIWNIDEHKKLLQFRLLAYIYEEDVENIVERFDERLKREDMQETEHRACHIVTYRPDILDKEVFDKDYNFMDSTKVSIIEHGDHIRLGYYTDI